MKAMMVRALGAMLVGGGAAAWAGPTLDLPSGVKVQLAAVPGPGAQYPGPADVVKVHYVGTFADGKEFDSSVRRGEPATFPLNRVIRCWTEGVQRIPVGGKATLRCPAATAYGERGAGGGKIPPHTDLTFQVELLSIVSRAPSQ